jgi:hypothetical protein
MIKFNLYFKAIILKILLVLNKIEDIFMITFIQKDIFTLDQLYKYQKVNL